MGELVVVGLGHNVGLKGRSEGEGCSGMKREEDKRDGKEKNQKRMGRGKVMGRI